MAHGGGVARKSSAGGGRLHPRSIPPLDPSRFHGFCYLFGMPPQAKRSTWGADLQQTREVFEALANALPSGAARNNENIPSGYTYLAQLVAHDLVESTEPLWVGVDAGIPVTNERHRSLQLDTLYGGGPTICPSAFQTGQQVEPDYSTSLKLGLPDLLKQPDPTSPCNNRDVARVMARNPSNITNFKDRSQQLLLADERNAEGAILSQLLVLFSILHNGVTRYLDPDLPPSARFQYARIAVLHMYWSVIRNDLLQRMLDEGVYFALQYRTHSSANWLWDGGDLPYEFSHGAYRIGHAMPRAQYTLNSRLPPIPISDVLEPRTDPLPSTWILEWSRFFDLGGVTNYAQRFEVTRAIALNIVRLMLSVGPNTPSTVLQRDWLSSAAAQMWRTEDLVRKVKEHYPDLTFLDTNGVKNWLDTNLTQQGAALTPTIRQHLSEDLPLPLYALLEAQLAPSQGQRAGTLASIIIGEVIFRRLTIAEKIAKDSSITEAAKRALSKIWPSIECVKCMPELIRQAACWGDLQQCPDMPFIVQSP